MAPACSPRTASIRRPSSTRAGSTRSNRRSGRCWRYHPTTDDRDERATRSAPAWRRAQPGRCTSAPRGRASTTSCSPVISAGPTCCASRTPISPAARPTSSATSSTTCTGWASPGTRGRRWPAARTSVHSGPTARANRSALYAAEAARLLESGHAYHCWCTPEELEAVRREQEARKEAPRYNGRCLRLTDADRAQFDGRGPAAGRPLQGAGRGGALRRPDPRRGRVRQRPARRLHHRARGRLAALPLRRRDRRREDGDQPRHSRRGPPLEHAEAHRPDPGARLPRAALRAHPADPERRPLEDEQAQVADVGHRLSRGGLPAGGDGQLPRLPGLEPRDRGGDLHPRRADRALRPGARPQGRRHLRQGSAGLPERGLHPQPDR